MSNGYVTNPLIFIISTLFHLYAFALILRFVLQAVRADFYNPLSQFVVRITSPVVIPARRFIPGYRGYDLATVFVTYIVLLISQAIVLSLSGYELTVLAVIIVSLTKLVSLFIDVFFYAILIQAIISWINPGNFNPMIGVINSITAPVLRPVQNLIPPIGGMDISPIFALIGLKVIEMLINPLLLALLQ